MLSPLCDNGDDTTIFPDTDIGELGLELGLGLVLGLEIEPGELGVDIGEPGVIGVLGVEIGESGSPRGADHRINNFSSGMRYIPPVLADPGGVIADSTCLPESLQLTDRLTPGVVLPLTRLLRDRVLRERELVRTKVEPKSEKSHYHTR